MEEKVIELKYSRKDFEEIYFRNGSEKTFFNKQLMLERNTFLLIGAIFIADLIYLLSTSENFVFLIVIGILFSYSFFNWYKKALPGIKWKREVKNYLNDLDKIKHNKIILTNNAFALVQDQKETIEKWTEFKRVELEENFISLISNSTTYLIPKKSMTSEEFLFFKTMIVSKIKNECNSEIV
jgi:hypothetical protein